MISPGVLLRSSRIICRAAVLVAGATVLGACGGRGSSLPAVAGVARTNEETGANAYRHDGVKPALLAGYGQSERQAERRRIAGVRGPVRPAGAHGQRFAVRRPTSGTGSPAAPTSALVLYDGGGQWNDLGELYAAATANLCGHFGAVTIEPVAAYAAGQIAAATATIYIGSQYSTSPADLPAAFFADVVASVHPVLWLGDNIWDLAQAVGPQDFVLQYGWDPIHSYFAPAGGVTQVLYQGQTLTRSVPPQDDLGVIVPALVDGYSGALSVVATAVNTGSSPQTTFPWAIRSSNLTYIGEVPFTYLNETDRLIALEDILFDQLAPLTPARHRALVRLEDLDAADDMEQIRATADYLYGAGVPFGFNVIPQYEDPLGAHNNGVPRSVSLPGAPALVSTIAYLRSHGGTLIEEGYTHQYDSRLNPYSGASGDDAEFFLAHLDPNANVVWDGPVPETSASWALARVDAGVAAFRSVGLPAPALWVTPHYFATDVDYAAVAARIGARYERSIYYAGTVAGTSPDYTQYIGQFFPYIVNDVYGTKVIPENLGDYQPLAENGHPARLAADIVAAAKDNLAVRDGFASFFYDPAKGIDALQTTVTGIKGLGYTFVDPGSL